MTTCLAPLHHRDLRRKRETETPTRRQASLASPRSLLRALTGADGIKLPHHPHRRRPRRS